MTDTTNARIREIAPGVTAEMIAEQTHLFYDPLTGGGTISFQARESLFVNDAYQPLAGGYDVLQVTIPDIAARCFGSGADPVTGADLSQLSAAGIALIIKAAYDTLYNERAAAVAAQSTQA
jgi:hypothetical protein